MTSKELLSNRRKILSRPRLAILAFAEDFIKPDLIARWVKVGAVLLLFLPTAVTLSLSITGAQTAQGSGTTAQKSTEFVPPDFSYSSVFAQYQRYQEEAATSWPEANATVGRIGGWRFYAEEAAQPDPPDRKLPPPHCNLRPLLFEMLRSTTLDTGANHESRTPACIHFAPDLSVLDRFFAGLRQGQF